MIRASRSNANKGTDNGGKRFELVFLRGFPAFRTSGKPQITINFPDIDS
ncbi:UNVERIFIED_ORG: hypothetical protein QOE_3610 [Clostridioides difficile F501]